MTLSFAPGAPEVSDDRITDSVVTMEHVSKSFRNVRALDDVSLDVRRGTLHAILGPNGAGKTTALNILLGLRRPDSGRVTVFGAPPDSVTARLQIGMTPQELGFPPGIRVRELLEFARGHFANPNSIEYLCGLFSLGELVDRPATALSGGQKRQLAVALAFAGAPRLVFLDEPTTGLDVDSRRAVWRGLREYVSSGGTILLTTHYLEEVEELAKRITVMRKGVMMLEGSVQEIKDRAACHRLRFRSTQMLALPEEVNPRHVDGLYTIDVTDLPGAKHLLAQFGIAESDIDVLPPTLEQAFVALTRNS